jgi:hypothetical protein
MTFYSVGGRSIKYEKYKYILQIRPVGKEVAIKKREQRNGWLPAAAAVGEVGEPPGFFWSSSELSTLAEL